MERIKAFYKAFLLVLALAIALILSVGCDDKLQIDDGLVMVFDGSEEFIAQEDIEYVVYPGLGAPDVYFAIYKTSESGFDSSITNTLIYARRFIASGDSIKILPNLITCEADEPYNGEYKITGEIVFNGSPGAAFNTGFVYLGLIGETTHVSYGLYSNAPYSVYIKSEVE